MSPAQIAEAQAGEGVEAEVTGAPPAVGTPSAAPTQQASRTVYAKRGRKKETRPRVTCRMLIACVDGPIAGVCRDPIIAATKSF